MIDLTSLQHPCATQGYYTVGTERFDHKISALLRASQLNIFPEWHFHREIYDNIKWEQDSGLSLTDSYKARALALRKQYDYLVLAFSGGSDSWTALQAFIDQNLHIDEIYVGHPNKISPTTISKSIDPTNVYAEWALTIRPMLSDIAVRLPKTKISVVDWTDNIEKFKYTQDYALSVDDNLSPGWGLRIPAVTDSQLCQIKKGKSVAVIFGIDKPQLALKDQTVYCYFLDIIANMRRLHPNDGRTLEFFYWSHHSPEIVHTQARAIFNWLASNPGALDLIRVGGKYNHTKKIAWDDIVRRIIYPEYTKLQAFQTVKPSTLVNVPYDNFIFKEHSSLITKSWLYEVTNIFKSIDSKYHEIRNNEIVGFKGFLSGFYRLGDIVQQNQ